MRLANNLQSMVIVSFCLHVVLFGVTSVAFKKRHSIYVPSSVKVDIIAPKAKTRVARPATKKTTEAKKSTVKPSQKKVEKAKPLLSTEEIKMLENRISDIESRRKTKELEEMIEQSVGKVSERDEVVSETESSSTGQVSSSYFGRGDPYFDMLYAQVKSNWVYFGTVEKGMQTIIEISIDSGGHIRVHRVEKSSGNDLLDRSVIRALKKASPVQAPPRKMGKIGFIFNP
ncbi:MAG: cell envelope integrity protein TolA [Nitrospirota bacterium]|nr:MAG: cell envelope integrity protein TolA [Nitrospirota bacterium]